MELSYAEQERGDFLFFSSRRRHTRLQGDWSSDVCSSDLASRYAFAWGRSLCGSTDAWVCTDRKSTRLNSSHLVISYAVFCLKKKNTIGTSRATPSSTRSGRTRTRRRT